MKFMITAEPTAEAANRLDSQPGGPGALFTEVAERYKPDAFYVHAGRRAATWVLDLADGGAVAEVFHFMLAHTGATPTFVPVLSGREAAEELPKAIARAHAR
ncbi:MAG: hypothetical protein U1F43_03240 [Myxococcota bacterium]